MTRLTVAAATLLGTLGLAGCREDGRGPELLAATVAASPVQVTESFSMPVRVTTFTRMSGCDNSPGPYITIEGELALGGLGSRLTFRNNQKGTHEYSDESRVELVVVPAGEAVVLPKQPVLGGVGGNPFIWIQFEDGNGSPLTGELYLGRCVQGLDARTDAELSALARALAEILVEDCANSPGPYISLRGDLALRSGVDAKLIFRNNDNPVGGPHQAQEDVVARVRLVPPGHTLTFPKQPVLGGVGGNPWIYFQFLSGRGEAIGSEALIGRCEQLSKA
ncbi:MAG TPA: hypothetical protein VNI61_05425 [Gemmatimonadales bacterium]|nr:hypothetical protein [Gemmatimonadales bacterium]